VSTLVEDETVKIDRAPGTTRDCQEFELRVGSRVLCRLIDTPGFEDAPRVLAWMRERERSAADRPEVVADFVRAHRGGGDFREECRLLAPILEGAGILYVVDASRPYRPNYEAEMEILQWTGRPRMALLNSISTEDHVEEWRRALDQYFSIVREFDAHDSTFELREDGRQAVDAAIAELEAEWRRRRREAAGHIADLVADALSFTLEWPLKEGERPDERREEWIGKFHDALRDRERRERAAVESLYRHETLSREEAELERPVVERDLFAETSWKVMGLDTWQLVRAGVIGGAAVGGTVDLAVGGASFLAGTVVGGVLGALSSYYGARGMAHVEMLGRKLGGPVARIGPLHNPNFPWLLLDRALLHYKSVVLRAHARRDTLVLGAGDGKQGLVARLGAAQQTELSRLFARLARGAGAQEDADFRGRLLDALSSLLERTEHDAVGKTRSR
jgi:hypothetical protein